MYLLTWNETHHRIDASLGGRITLQEAKVFTEDVAELIQDIHAPEFCLRLDRSKVSFLEDGVDDVFETSLSEFRSRGAGRITVITRDESEALQMIDRNLQAVLEGAEEFIPLAEAA